jgi:hypothetical protein
MASIALEAEMARWRSLGAFVIGNRKYRAGQTYADTAVNALAGDVVYAAFGTSSGISPLLVPLDSSAIALMGASVFANSPRPCSISGANSVDG